MAADDTTYRERIVNICELGGVRGIIDGLTFIERDVKGPAVLLLNNVSINDGTFPEDLNAILWELPPDRPQVSGAMLVRNCTFERCLFFNVGFAGPPDFIKEMRQSMVFTPDVSQVAPPPEGALPP